MEFEETPSRVTLSQILKFRRIEAASALVTLDSTDPASTIPHIGLLSFCDQWHIDDFRELRNSDMGPRTAGSIPEFKYSRKNLARAAKSRHYEHKAMDGVVAAFHKLRVLCTQVRKVRHPRKTSKRRNKTPRGNTPSPR